MIKVQKIAVSALLALALTVAVLCGTLSQAASASSYRSWKQTDPGWGSLLLGSSGETVGQSGCAVVAMATLMVHSGAVTSKSFTPATAVNYLNRHGGFDSHGNLQWWVIEGYAGNFEYEGTAQLSGSQQQRLAKIRELLEEGYYLLASVKYGEHFVAIDSVSGNDVSIIDPAYPYTSLFANYTAGSVDSLRLFNVNSSALGKPSAGMVGPSLPDMTNPPAPVPETPAAPVLENPPAPDPETPTAPAPVNPPVPNPETPPVPKQEAMDVPAPVNPPVPDPETPPVPENPPVLENPPAPLQPSVVTPPMPLQTPAAPF